MIEDWQAEKAWKNGRVRNDGKLVIWISLLFAVLFIGLSLPATMAVPDEVGSGNYAILLALLFPLVGVGALFYAIYALYARRKFGNAEIILDPAPGCIGGDCGGRLQLNIPYDAKNEFSITLNCLHTRTTGSGKNRSSNTSTRWQREGLAKTEATADGGTLILFKFAVPDNLKPSEKHSNSYHHWMLNINCEFSGIDFNRSFNMPVIRLPEAQKSSLDVHYAKDSKPLTELPPGMVNITQTVDGLRFYYPWYRNIKPAIILILFGAIFFTTGLFIGKQADETIFSYIFSAIGAIAMLAGLYMTGNTMTTHVSPTGIQVIRNIFGLRFQRNVDTQNIVELERTVRMQTNGSKGNTLYYAIVANTADKRSVTLADSLQGSRVTDFIEERIRGVLGLNRML